MLARNMNKQHSKLSWSKSMIIGYKQSYGVGRKENHVFKATLYEG